MSRKKLNWKNLLKYKCPKCGSDFVKKDNGIKCAGKRCDFFITNERLDQVVKDMSQPKQPWEN